MYNMAVRVDPNNICTTRKPWNTARSKGYAERGVERLEALQEKFATSGAHIYLWPLLHTAQSCLHLSLYASVFHSSKISCIF